MTHNRVSAGVSPVLPTPPHQAAPERAATEDFHLISSCQYWAYTKPLKKTTFVPHALYGGIKLPMHPP